MSKDVDIFLFKLHNIYKNIDKSIKGDERATYEETVLEKLSQKLTAEFGKGFMFVGSQVRLTLEDDHFYPDLVFYNRLLTGTK